MSKRNTTIRDKHRATIRRGEPPCWICGQAIDYAADWLDPNSFTIDHVVPLHKGGQDRLDNIKPAHRGCNRAKGTRNHAPIIRRPAGIVWPD